MALMKYATPAVLAVLLAVAGCGDQKIPPTPSAIAEIATPAPPPVAASEATFAFEPLVGIPVNTADDLARDIGEAAQRQKLPLVRRVDENASYRVRGYLSAVGNESGTTVIYVYDFFHGERRVHRVSGQETAGGTRGDPWTAVDGKTLTNIAERAVAGLKAWLTRAAG